MKLSYPRQVHFVGRSGGVLWSHFAIAVVIVALVLWGVFGPSRPMLGFAGLCGAWLAFDLYNRYADETFFLIDPNGQAFLVRRYNFGRLENEVQYPLSLLKGFETDDAGNGYSRIVAVMEDGHRIPLQSSHADYYFGFTIKRMNATIADLRGGKPTNGRDPSD